MKYNIERDYLGLKTYVSLKGFTGFGLSDASSNQIEIAFKDYDNQEEPEQSQIKALDYLVEHSEKILHHIFEFIYKNREELEEVFGEFDGECGFPHLNSPADVKEYIDFYTVYIHKANQDEISNTGLYGRCTWDPEHGVGVLLHEDKILDFGGWDTAHGYFDGSIDDKAPSVAEMYGLEALDLWKEKHKTTRLRVSPSEFPKYVKLFDKLVKMRVIYGYRSSKVDLTDFEKFAFITNLESLDFNRKLKDAIPENLDLLKNLKDLDISGNKLKEIPAFVAELPQLESLNASYNSFSEIKDNLQLKNLRRLNLSGNRLKSFPSFIREMTDLEYLFLWNNQIAKIPDWIDELSSLEDFRISDNKLRKIPSGIKKMPNLKIFYAGDNKFSFFQKLRIKRMLNKHINVDL